MTGDLAVWLRAQLDADEQTVRAATPGPWEADGWDVTVPSLPAGGADDRFIAAEGCGLDAETNAEHIALHDPAFTLADITAKRTIIDLHQPTETDWYGPTQIECVCCVVTDYPCATVRLLAQPYAGRPGWHNEWTTT